MNIFSNFDVATYVLYIFFSPTAWVSYLLVVLETIILAIIKAPNFGLRLVPAYGKYYYWKMTAPCRKVWIIPCIITDYVKVLMLGLFIMSIAQTTNGSDDSIIMIMSFALFGFMLVFLTVLVIMASLVFKSLINFDVAENFLYPKFLGCLFAFVPVIGTFCCLTNAKKAREAGCFSFDKNQQE